MTNIKRCVPLSFIASIIVLACSPNVSPVELTNTVSTLPKALATAFLSVASPSMTVTLFESYLGNFALFLANSVKSKSVFCKYKSMASCEI